MKDPAFLFYPSDFLTGCIGLTMEERGQYITLLCIQHQTGRLNEKTIRLSVGSVSVDVLCKFQKDENDNYFNDRLEKEIEKRTKFTESRHSNGKLGGRPSKNNNLKKTDRLIVGKPTENLIENENINENIDIIGDYNISIEECKKKSESDISWRESICMRHTLTVDTIKDQIETFCLKLRADGEDKKDYPDFKHHFNSWLNYERQKRTTTNRGAATQPIGTSNGKVRDYTAR